MNALGTGSVWSSVTADSGEKSYLPFGLFSSQQNPQPATTATQERSFLGPFQSRLTVENPQQQQSPFMSLNREESSATMSNILNISPPFARGEKIKPKPQFPFDTLSELSPEVILLIAVLLAWFFLPTGIVAIVFAFLALSEHKKGTNRDLAEAYTSAAQKWIVVTMLIVTVMVFLALVVVLVMQIVSFFSHKSNSHEQHQPSH